MRKALLFAPMLMLLLTACGGEEKDPAAELQAQYANLTGAVMEADVSCHYADEDRAYTLLCDYAPDRSTVTVLSPANLAGISATVENGTVTGKGPGSAVITASAGMETATCQVTVQAAVVLPELVLNHRDFTLPSGDPPVQMKVTVKGTRDLYDGEIVWTSQDTNVVSISQDGLVERVGRGTTTVTAIIGDMTLECIVRVPR